MSLSIIRAATLLSFFATGLLGTNGTLTAAPARMTNPATFVDGRYHSITNGIPDYDGFDRFRDPAGKPLPGWDQILRSPG